MAGAGINTGFEGIAATDGKLFLAHEMFPNFIVRYSIDGGAFKPDTIINIPGSSDITGLEYEGGSLYALGRTGSHVYKLDPVTGAVKTVAAFGREADNQAYRFEQPVDYYRNSEGLAVGRGRVFIVLDGNFKVGLADQNERRPLILIYKRPAGF
jgi:hypothetical protein